MMEDHINKDMSELTHDDKNRLFMTLDAQTEQLKTLQRGIYGDKDNGVKGVIKDIEDIKKWIFAANLKVAKVSGAMFVILFFIKGLIDWLISLKK